MASINNSVTELLKATASADFVEDTVGESGDRNQSCHIISTMKQQIQTALDVLIGQSLWSSGRAADLEWFEFGSRVTVKDSRGETKQVGEYALHVQCAWRIRCNGKVVVASRDLYYPPEENEEGPADFNWDVQRN